MECAPDVPHLFERASLAHPVGQENEIAVSLGIDPQRRAGETDVSDIRSPHDDVVSMVSHPSARELPGTRLFVVKRKTAEGVSGPPR